MEKIIDKNYLDIIETSYCIPVDSTLKVIYETDGCNFEGRVVEYDSNGNIARQTPKYCSRLFDEDIANGGCDNTISFMVSDALGNKPFIW